jgi:hypothetical protein
VDKVCLLPNTKNSVLWRRRHLQQKLHEASNTIDKVGVRRRAIDRRLRGVEILPEMEAGAAAEAAVASLRLHPKTRR